MCRIERKIAENPLVDIYREPEGDQLNEAIVKAFGFKSCHVYWMRDPNMGNIGPCTDQGKRGKVEVMAELMNKGSCHLCAGKVALGDEGVVHLHKHSRSG